MSDRRLPLALLLTLVTGAVLPAQQPGDTPSAQMVTLRMRADSLRRAMLEQQRTERDADLAPEVRVRGVRLRTTAGLQPLATAAIEDALGKSREFLGTDVDSLAAHMEFTLREVRSRNHRVSLFGSRGSDTALGPERTTSAKLEGSLDGADLTGFFFPWPVASDELASSMLTLFERGAAGRLSAPLEPWLNHRLSLRDPPLAFWTDLYRQLATSDAAVNRRCAGGDRGACRAAFALDTMPSDRVAAWYDETDFPKLANTAGDPLLRDNTYRALATEEREDCTARNRTDTCRRMLALLAPEAFRIPMPDAGRASLVRIALQIGGPDAARRLRFVAAATVAAQIGAASNVPVDSVIGLWQQRLMASRPHSPLPGTGFVLASMACIVVCGAWATRGQPWR